MYNSKQRNLPLPIFIVLFVDYKTAPAGVCSHKVTMLPHHSKLIQNGRIRNVSGDQCISKQASRNSSYLLQTGGNGGKHASNLDKCPFNEYYRLGQNYKDTQRTNPTPQQQSDHISAMQHCYQPWPHPYVKLTSWGFYLSCCRDVNFSN